MSMTMEALWSIHSLAERTDVSQATEFVARRGGRGFKLSFFYGPMWLLLLAGLGGWYYQYRKGNPEKAKNVEQRLRGVSASATRRLKTAIEDTRQPSGPNRYDAHAPGKKPKRFNPPPNWPVPHSGWTPDQNWRPDPSWPPAPPGWQFWIDDESTK